MDDTFLNIITWLEQNELPCLFKKYFYVDCPGCGFQRSVVALLNGDVAKSFVLFPAFIPLLFFFAFFFLNNKYQLVKMRLYLNVGITIVFTIFLLSYCYKFI